MEKVPIYQCQAVCLVYFNSLVLIMTVWAFTAAAPDGAPYASWGAQELHCSLPWSHRLGSHPPGDWVLLGDLSLGWETTSRAPTSSKDRC